MKRKILMYVVGLNVGCMFALFFAPQAIFAFDVPEDRFKEMCVNVHCPEIDSTFFCIKVCFKGSEACLPDDLPCEDYVIVEDDQ